MPPAGNAAGRTGSPMREHYKLAFVVSLFFEYGGMQRTLLRIALECVARGHEVHVFTGGWQGERPPALRVHEIDTRALTNTASNDRLAATTAQRVAAGDYDCLVGFTKLPGLDVYYAGDPCYAARVDEDKPSLYKLLPRYRQLRRQEAAVFARGLPTEILLIAHAEREKFQRYYGTETARFHLLPAGINRARLLEAAARPRPAGELRAGLGIAAQAPVILLVGSRFRTKGLDRALRAVAALPDDLRGQARLVVVGGDRSGPFRRLARRLGVADNVVFAGAREDIADFYRMADLLLHPPYSENTGTVLIEAMFCALPVLTTANCGFAFHVRAAGAGTVCPEPFRQATLNAALADMLTSPERAAWARNGREYCARTDFYSLIDKAADVITALARRNRERP